MGDRDCGCGWVGRLRMERMPLRLLVRAGLGVAVVSALLLLLGLLAKLEPELEFEAMLVPSSKSSNFFWTM